MLICFPKTSLPCRTVLLVAFVCACAATLGRASYFAFADAALIEAARDGRTDDAQTWLARGADVNAADEFGDTALMYAARNAHPALVRVLLAQGAKPAVSDHFGLTAVRWAGFHLRDSRTYRLPEGLVIRQVPRPQAQETIALLNGNRRVY